MPLAKHIVNLNEYDLTGTPEAFTEAITALVTKTEAEGHKGVLRYAFYTDAASGTAAANIVYADANAWIDHHKMVYDWPEMPAFQATVKLRRITFLGPFNQAMQDWLDAASIAVPLIRLDNLAAGFER